MRKIKNILAIVWAACFLLVLISACKEDDKDALLPNQGEICFQFTKITTYTLADLDDIATVKIVLEKDGVKIELPSYPLTGNTELLSTEKVRLEEGHYKLLSYRAFGKDANLIENLDITLTEDNEFDVKVGELQEYILPVKVKTVVDPTNNYTNVLFAICKEVLGTIEVSGHLLGMWKKHWIPGPDSRLRRMIMEICFILLIWILTATGICLNSNI